MEDDDDRSPAQRSSGSSTSLQPKDPVGVEGTEGGDAFSEEEPSAADLFGSESEEEPAVSRVEAVKASDAAEGVTPHRVRILPDQLELPIPGFSQEGTELPAEFKLDAPIELKFSAVRAEHPSEAVSLFAPGELIDVDLQFFDASLPNGYQENGTYPKRVIRWRKTPEGLIESNTKVVEWDDGSFSFFIEGRWYDMGRESFANGTEILCIDQQNCLQALHSIGSGYCPVAVPDDYSDDESEAQIVTEVVQVQRHPKTKRVTVLGNPVKEREAKLKKIQEDQRDREIMERKQRLLQEKYTLPSLDQLGEEDEDPRPAQLHTKRTRPSRRQPARAKKHRPEEYDEDFVQQDEEEEMELGEDEEEELLSDSEESEAETAEKDTEQKEQTDSPTAAEPEPVLSRDLLPEKEESRETKPQRVILLSEEDEDDVSDS